MKVMTILGGVSLFMLGAGLMASIIGFPIGVILFAAGLALIDEGTNAKRTA